MTAPRHTTQQFFCQKCNGTGRVLRARAMDNTPIFDACDHAKRTDTTGIDDDTERILYLERKLSECAASCEAEAAKAYERGLEDAAKALEGVVPVKINGIDVIAVCSGTQAIRALKVSK